MRIDPEVERPTRDLLGHAIRAEWEEFAVVVQEVGEIRLIECLGLCLRVAGYIAIDICGQAWPTRADLREIAQRMAAVELDFDIAESDIYDCLDRSALGFESLSDVFPDSKEKVGTVPVLVAATLLVSYRPDGRDWWDYLEQIEQALEIATDLTEAVVPALLLLTRRQRALKSATTRPDA